MHPAEAIAVTGMGVIAPIGVGVPDFAAALACARPGLRVRDDLAGEPATLVGTAPDFAPRTRVPVRRLRRLTRLSQMAVVAAHEAADEAGLAALPAERVGVVLGTGLGALETTVSFMREYLAVGPSQANPALFPSSIMNAAAAHVTMELGFKGYSTTVNHKDSSALAAVALAVDLLRLGRADAVVCGGVDELSPALLHGYRRFGALTRAGAVRPFDRRRDGLAPGEGTALFVLERAADAARRGAAARALIAGVGLGGDRRGLLSWDGDGDGAFAAIGAALAEAGLASADLDHVASAANGTPQRDRLEARILARVFGARPVPTSSILGQTGDFPAAGALQLAAAIVALDSQAAPGTLGFEEPDPAAPVPGLLLAPGPRAVTAALVCAHATGGAEVALIVCRAAPSVSSGAPLAGAGAAC